MKVGSKIVLVPVLASVLVCGMVAAEQCLVPHDSTEYCTDLPEEGKATCDEHDEVPGLCDLTAARDRNKFPIGTKPADEGVTTEARADCWRTQSCTYDTDASKCIASSEWSAYKKADKIVNDEEKECPSGS